MVVFYIVSAKFGVFIAWQDVWLMRQTFVSAESWAEILILSLKFYLLLVTKASFPE